MTIPRREREHWDAAVDAVDEPALRTDVAEGVPEQSPLEAQLHARLVGQAREIKATCPDVWEVLDAVTRPRPHACALMQPSIRMTSGEIMAYNLGLDAVGLWLRSLADEDLPQEKPSHDDMRGIG